MVRQITVCLNGNRKRSEHPAIPLTPAELAMSARAAVDAGAEAVHLHPRAADGTESLISAHIGPAVSAVRRSCPGVPIGVSTGLWITSGDVWRRHQQVARWADLSPTQRPDFASVNVSEPGFSHLTTALSQAGIGVEAGVWSVADAHTLGAMGAGWLRVLVEIVDTPADTCLAEADLILAALATLDLPIPLLLHGEHEACWPLVQQAGRLGLPTRIGLEDVTTGPTGETIRDNAHLVRLALREWHTAAWPN